MIEGGFFRLVPALIALFLLTACTSPPVSAAPEMPDQRDSVTFIDSLGRHVTVSNPQRVAALTGSFADMWCLAGGKEQLVAAAGDTWTQFDLGLP